MPVHDVPGGGKQWGGHGKVYRGKDAAKKAQRQAAAAYANGYTGKSAGGVVGKPARKPRGRG